MANSGDNNSANKGPKHRLLTEDETFASFGEWQSRMKAVLRKDGYYTRFLLGTGADSAWKKTSDGVDCRGLLADTSGEKTSKETKLLHLTGMLEEISQWAPHYIAHEIVNESTSIESVWDIIRSYYQFQQNEIQFLSLLKITWEGRDKERPEHLYRRIMAHIYDNLLKKDGKLTYNGKSLTKNEEVSPTVERMAIARWMELIDPRLPQLVARTFANDLQTKTLKDIQPQISSNIDGFLEELQHSDSQAMFMKATSNDVIASRVHTSKRPQTSGSRWQPKQSIQRGKAQDKPKLTCRLCRAEGRNYIGHSMGNCGYIGSAEKRDMVKSYKVNTFDGDEHEPAENDFDDEEQEQE